MRPGETQFTRIFRGASSFDSPRVRVRTPPLAAEYASAPPPPPSRAASDDRFTIAPPSARYGSAAGVVDKDVDAVAERLSCLVDEAFRVLRARNVGLYRTRPPAARLHLGYDSLGLVAAGEVVHDNRRAAFGELDGHRATDVARTTGDDRHAPLKISAHRPC